MNERSLQESNAVLAAASSRTTVGELIPASPGDLAGEAGIGNRLAAARAIRALLARGRIAQEGQRYRLIDDRPVEPGEVASVRRTPRPRRRREPEEAEQGPPTYEQLGRLIVERLIEASAEVAELRSAVERARTEAERARRETVEVNRTAAADRRRADSLEDEVRTLKRRLEMTESNLRSIVQAAKARPASPLDDGDARAILDILSRKDQPEAD